VLYRTRVITAFLSVPAKIITKVNGLFGALSEEREMTVFCRTPGLILTITQTVLALLNKKRVKKRELAPLALAFCLCYT
jgi:hypothetical protein